MVIELVSCFRKLEKSPVFNKGVVVSLLSLRIIRVIKKLVPNLVAFVPSAIEVPNFFYSTV